MVSTTLSLVLVPPFLSFFPSPPVSRLLFQRLDFSSFFSVAAILSDEKKDRSLSLSLYFSLSILYSRFSFSYSPYFLCAVHRYDEIARRVYQPRLILAF